MSAGQKSRHINIRYFWIKDQTKGMDINIRHCPTLAMLADFFTKPLSGNLFRKFRDVILGYKPVSSLRETMPHEVEERVEISERLQDRHNVPQDVVSKIKFNVSMNVPIVSEKYSTSSTTDGFNGFIKLIEYSRQ